MGLNTMKNEKYDQIHFKDCLVYRTERIYFLYGCFTSKINGYTDNILDNFYIKYRNLTNRKHLKNFLISPKINIGYDSNFKIFSMIDSIDNLDVDLKFIYEIDTECD